MGAVVLMVKVTAELIVKNDYHHYYCLPWDGELNVFKLVRFLHT